MRHLPEVHQIGAHNGHAISARQVRDAAASRGRGIGHHGDGGTLKQIGQRVFRNVSAELDARVSGAALFDGFDVAGRLRVVTTGNHEFGVGQPLTDRTKGFDHKFEALICAPLAESKNVVGGGATAGKIGEFRPARQNAMRAQVDVIASIFVIQNLAIAGHEHGDGIGEQQHARRHCTRETI